MTDKNTMNESRNQAPVQLSVLEQKYDELIVSFTLEEPQRKTTAAVSEPISMEVSMKNECKDEHDGWFGIDVSEFSSRPMILGPVV